MCCFPPQTLAQTTMEAERIALRYNFSKLLESGCILSDLFSSDQLSNHQFEDTHSKRELLAGKLHRIASRGQLLAVEVTLWDLANENGCDKISPIDNELSRIHETKVHTLSDSALHLGTGSPSMPDLRFTQMRKERLEHCRNTAKSIDGTTLHLVFHTLPGQQQTRSQHRRLDTKRSRRRWTTIHSNLSALSE